MTELARALSAEDPKARLAALKAVLDRMDASACPVVAGAVPAEAHPKVRAAMAMVLGRVGGMTQAGVLAKMTTDRDAGVRLRAVEALAGLKDPACWATLVRVLGAEEEAAVRDAAAHFLMGRGKDNLLGLFKQMVVSEKAWKREAVVRACQMFNSSAVVPLLKHAATKETEPGIKEAARNGLKKLAGQGNQAAAQVEAELKAAEAPPVFDLSEELAAAEAQIGLAFHDTYTGDKLGRVEIADHFGEDEEAPPPKPAPPPPAPLESAPKARRPVPEPVDGGMVARPRPPSLDKVPLKTRACPVCGEEIQVNAKKCRFCNEVFDAEGLKQVQKSAGNDIEMPMPSALSVMTCLQYIAFGFGIFGAFLQLGGGQPGGAFGLVIFGGLFFLVGKVRDRSQTAWRIMLGLQVLGTAGSLDKPTQLLFSAIFIGVMLSQDVRNYCSR